MKYGPDDNTIITSGDETIERAPRNGIKGAAANPDNMSAKLWRSSPLFAARVADAVQRMNSGESHLDIRTRHGAVVLRAAIAEVNE